MSVALPVLLFGHGGGRLDAGAADRSRVGHARNSYLVKTVRPLHSRN